SRGSDMLDIEFTGGTAAQVIFVEPQQTEQVRAELGQYESELPDLRVYSLGDEDLEYRVETTNLELEQVRDRISSTFGDQLRRNHLTFDIAAAQPISRESLIEAGGGAPAVRPADTAPATGPEGVDGEPGEEGTPGETPAEQPAQEGENPVADEQPLGEAGDEAPTDEPADPAPADPASADPAPISEQPTADDPSGPETTTEPPASDDPIVDETIVEPAGEGGEEAGETETPVEFEELIGGTRVQLKFDERIDQTSVSRRVDEAMQSLGFASPFRVSRPDVAAGSRLKSNEWTLEIALSAEQTERLLTQMAEQIEAEPVFAALNNIGSQVAGDARWQAFVALTFSLLSIVAYIWFRFQRVAFGLAAVVALIHDVAIMLGILALCGYLVQYAPAVAGLLLIEDFKISLTILAGFLTVIGYSLNDTIVVFDRIREVRGKSPDLTEAMINDSVNQTLSRTLLTSFTTFIVVFILYLIGGPGIHG
ncbi:MAG: protein translocase subunit SecF, partial [Pirellulales bacterium]